MDDVRFCAVCGRMLENEYLYCPYCGTAFQVNGDLCELIEEPFMVLEDKVFSITLTRLCELENVLVKIERDLDDFLSTV